jgi:glycosyltransferase involved in cell wall biosynthesis
VRHEISFRNRFQADVIVANDPTTAGLLGYLISLSYGRPLNIHMGYDPLSFSYASRSPVHLVRSFFALLMVRYAHTLTVVQESAQRSVTRIYRSLTDRVTLIPRYFDLDAIQAQDAKENVHAKYPQFRAILLVAAPLTRNCNIEVAIQSVKELSEYYSQIGLLIVGNGPYRGHLQRYAHKLGIADQVIFEPGREDLTSYFKTAYALMMPSLNETFQTTLEEAAAAGCPIIAANVGIAPKIIEHGKNGYLCNPKMPSEFWAAAGTLIRNPAIRTVVKQQILASMQAYMSGMSGDKDAHVHLYTQSWEAAIKTSHEK